MNDEQDSNLIADHVINWYKKNNLSFFISDNWLRSKCFLHGGNNPSALKINLITGWGQCYSCGQSVNPFKIFGLKDSITYDDYKKISKDYNQQFSNEKLSHEFVKYHRMNESYLGQYSEPKNEYLEFLMDRGLTLKEIKKFEIKACDLIGSRDYQRVVFPVRSQNKHLVNFSMRKLPEYMEEKTPKYTFYEKPKINYMYNSHNMVTGQPIIITEGVFDVIALDKANIPNVISPLGLAITKHQMKFLLSPKYSMIIFAFDNMNIDDASRSYTEKYVQQITEKNPQCQIKIMTQPSGIKDWGEMLENDMLKDIKKIYNNL
jgi:DNA primase